MNRKILLDREGDLPTQPGVQVIESEVDFLRFATSDKHILIRGDRLCAWAESFYALRGQLVKHLVSPRATLRCIFPSLSVEQAHELAEKIGGDALSEEDFSPTTAVLLRCYPDDYGLWQGSPSLQHAAQWLIWLTEHTPSDAEKSILVQFAAVLTRQAGESPIAELYQIVTRDKAKSMLLSWLGAAKKVIKHLGEFPLELPHNLLEEIKDEWMKCIIKQKGAFFTEMVNFPLPPGLRQELGRLTAEFYKKNPQYLTLNSIRDLQPYINTQMLSVLDEHLPPPEPSPMPEVESAVLEWFQNDYLPYRRWQSRFGNRNAQNTAVQHAQTFARWVLKRYPSWLMDNDWLAFTKSAQLLGKAADSLILCIILDGLPAWDAEDLAKSISSRIGRLTLQQKNYCFASIPTVTEFAKDALLKGLPPCLAPQSDPLGCILPDKVSPKGGLRDANPGEIVFWRVEQPDKAYHFERDDKRERKVHAELESILCAIQETVENLPDSIKFQIIITSDHGRLLNSNSPRCLPVPAKMKAHGRALWGQLKSDFDEIGFVINERDSWVDISGVRYGMEHDLRLAWGEESFQTAKSGNESYPHGGLFPEEMIVPWFWFERDADPPDLEITIHGTGEEEMRGELTISIVNNSHLQLECLEISLSTGATLRDCWLVEPLALKVWDVTMQPWPTQDNVGELSAKIVFRQPNGTVFVREVTPDIEVKSLYKRSDDILKDLDL